MAKPSSSPSLCFSSLFVFLPRGGNTISYVILFLSVISLLIQRNSLSSVAADESHFEGFDAEEDDENLDDELLQITDLHYRTGPPPTTLSLYDPESDNGPPILSDSSNSSQPPDLFDYWDEDEFEGLPVPSPLESTKFEVNATTGNENSDFETIPTHEDVNVVGTYKMEIVCVSFLIVLLVNYFIGRRENENIALAWATKFGTKDSIFEKNFSLLGVGEGEDSPLLMKEGQNVFKFYASGRRFCQGLLATLELKSRHDLIARLYNMLVPCRDEINFEVYMNDDAMDQVVFAMAKKKIAKAMLKEERDFQRFASVVLPPSNRKWIPEDLTIISESKEVAGDLITEAVLDQVFGEKSYEKFGKGFILMQFSDQHPGPHKKMLRFKFILPDVKHMAAMTRLIALVPYYIDLIGRYKLSSQPAKSPKSCVAEMILYHTSAMESGWVVEMHWKLLPGCAFGWITSISARTKTETARYKIAQEIYRELQNARQEALQKKKAERKKMEAAESKTNIEALRKKEAKERARQLKKAMPKVKMTRAH